MGEKKNKRTATEKLIINFPRCCLCGGSRPSSTRDHIPPTALFDGSHRPDGMVTPACEQCNKQTSTADLVASIVSRWRYDPPAYEGVDHGRLVARLKKQAPSIISEWTSMTVAQRVTAQRHLQEKGVHAPNDSVIKVGPATIKYLNLFAHKILLGLYFAKMGEGLPSGGGMWAYWRTKEDYQRGGLPRQLIEMLPRHDTLAQGKWNTRDTFEVRFDLNKKDGIFGCVTRMRANLFVGGFALRDITMLGSTDRRGFISPNHFLEILSNPYFEKRKN